MTITDRGAKCARSSDTSGRYTPIRVERADLHALDRAAFARWEEESHQVHEALFGRALLAVHLDRETSCFARAVLFRDGDRPIGRANLTIFESEIQAPDTGRRTPAYVCVGSGGVLPAYDARVKVYPFVLSTMARFHLTRLGSRRSVYLLANNLSPLSSFLFARFMPQVHPYPLRSAPGLEKLRGELIEQLYPSVLGEYRERGLISGPPPRAHGCGLRGGNRLLWSYVEMHGDPRAGDRLPMLVRMNKVDLAVALRRYAAMTAAKALGVYEPDRVEPYGLTEVLVKRAIRLARLPFAR